MNDENEEENKNNSKNNQIEKYYNYLMNYEEENTPHLNNTDDTKEISDLDKILNSGSDDPVEIEKLFGDLGPFIICNNINISTSEIINSEIDDGRLAEFIIYMVNQPKVKMGEELKELNRIFLESLAKLNSSVNLNRNLDEYINLLEENLNKELTWDLSNVYKLFKKNIDCMNTDQVL